MVGADHVVDMFLQHPQNSGFRVFRVQFVQTTAFMWVLFGTSGISKRDLQRFAMSHP